MSRYIYSSRLEIEFADHRQLESFNNVSMLSIAVITSSGFFTPSPFISLSVIAFIFSNFLRRLSLLLAEPDRLLRSSTSLRYLLLLLGGPLGQFICGPINPSLKRFKTFSGHSLLPVVTQFRWPG